MLSERESEFLLVAREQGFALPDPAYRHAWNIAWEERHVYGVQEVRAMFGDLCILIATARSTA